MIALDPDLDCRSQTAALAHELVHDERRIPTSGVPALLADKEERTVERIVALRLVPPDELADHVESVVALDGAVTAEGVADVFEVPVEVAALSLHLLVQTLTRSRVPVGA